VSNRKEVGVAGGGISLELKIERWGRPGAQGQHCGTFPKASNPPIVSKPKNPGLFQPATRSTLAAAFSIFTKLGS